MGEFLKIGAPCALMVCLEWWVWELQMIWSGWFTVEEQAAQIILMNIAALFYMVSLGFEVAACALIGNQIGL